MSQRRASKHAAAGRETAGRAAAQEARGRQKPAARRRTASGKASRPSRAKRRWSQEVTETSDALDLRAGVFTLDDPEKIAASLKRSAEHSDRRKADPYRSAMSMLTFYINRGGRNLSALRKAKLERAKGELRRLFHRA